MLFTLNFKYFIYFFFLVFVTKELFFFDEEFLVVSCFFFVFFLLLRFIAEIISNELFSRRNLVIEQFENYLNLRFSFLNLILDYYFFRNNFLKSFTLLLSSFSWFFRSIFFFKFDELNIFLKFSFLAKLARLLDLEGGGFRRDVSNSFTSQENKDLFFSEFSSALLINSK